jgi:hypothetical protein
MHTHTHTNKQMNARTIKNNKVRGKESKNTRMNSETHKQKETLCKKKKCLCLRRKLKKEVLETRIRAHMHK